MKVLVSDKLSQDGVKKLQDAGFEVDVKTGLPEDEIVKIIANYDAMVVRSETKVTPKIIEAANKLKIVGRAGVGVDNIDLPAATKKGIIVVNSPEGNTVAAAELTLAMMLALARKIPEAYISLQEGKWERSKFTGVEFYGKTIGVIGLGKIGSRVASYAHSLGMQVIGNDPYVSEEKAKKIGVTLKSLDEIYKSADYISLHLPKTKETLHMIGKKELDMMKDGVRIVNCARGGIIDEGSLIEALKSGKVAGAALDVYEKEPLPSDSPLLKVPNLITVPHLGASTKEAQINVAIDVVEQIVDVLNGGTARSAVNIPSMKPELLEPVRAYLPLAEKIGLFVSQLVDGVFESVDITYLGELAALEVSPLTTSLLKGLLQPVMQESVNFVNAPVIAKERGIKVTESKSEESTDFANLITVKIKGPKQSRTVSGTLFGSFGPRITAIDDFKTDVVPEGYILVCSHKDKPGIVGKIGTYLGNKGINIAGMDVGRSEIGGRAVMLLNVDDVIPDKLIAEIE
ncbi:MAG: phosphoglycerate dehydrogenase, partial [bacterium]